MQHRCAERYRAASTQAEARAAEQRRATVEAEERAAAEARRAAAEEARAAAEAEAEMAAFLGKNIRATNELKKPSHWSVWTFLDERGERLGGATHERGVLPKDAPRTITKTQASTASGSRARM